MSFKKDTKRCVLIPAGGASTRLPNKLFLALENGAPLFTSAIDYALRLGFIPADIIIITEGFDSLIEKVIRRLYPAKDFSFMNSSGGTLTALIEAARIRWGQKAYSELDECIVLFPDNYYGNKEKVLPESKSAIVRPVKGHFAKELIRLNANGKWTRDISDMSQDNTLWHTCLTSPWNIPYTSLRSFTLSKTNTEDPVVSFLNHVGIQPQELPLGRWIDIGTPDTLREYWTRKADLNVDSD